MIQTRKRESCNRSNKHLLSFSIPAYINAMEELIHQEIVIGLQDASKHFWEAAKRLQDVGDQINPFCKCTKPKKVRSVVKIVRKEGKNKGKMFYSCGKPRKKEPAIFFNGALRGNLPTTVKIAIAVAIAVTVDCIPRPK